jgi:hypothetical protein
MSANAIPHTVPYNTERSGVERKSHNTPRLNRIPGKTCGSQQKLSKNGAVMVRRETSK